MATSDGMTRPDDVFGAPVRWRAEAARALGLAGEDLIAAVSPAPSGPTALYSLLRALPSQPRVVVDVGAGSGGVSELVRRLTGARVLAVEPSTVARRVAMDEFPELVVLDGHAEQTGLPAELADLVMLVGVLSLLDPARAAVALAEARRVLEPGGYVGICDLFASGTKPLRSGVNMFRDPFGCGMLLLDHGFDVRHAGLGMPVPSPHWQAIGRRVDDWIVRHHAGEPAYDAWVEDRDHLQRHIASGDVIGGCILGRLPES
jgi:SAM-dependent methyltransferase